MARRTSATSSSITIDEAIEILGAFSRFQWILDAALCFVMSPIAYQILLMYFAAYDPSWACTSNSTICLLNGTFPSSDRERCNMPRSEWKYTTTKDFSISTEFDLQCENGWIKHLLTSIVFVGWALGAVVLGSIADNYGRKKVIYPSTAMIVLLGVLCTFFGNVTLIIVCRFFIGFFIPGANVQTYILVSEYVGSKHRPIAGIIIFISFQINLCLMALKAYFIPKWKLFTIVCTAPYLLSLLTFFFVPESIRWIRLKRGQKELISIFNRISHWNKKVLPTNVFIKRPTEDIIAKTYTLRDIFNTKRLAILSLVLGFAWMVIGMVYYGVMLAAADLGGSIYTNFALLAAVGIPSNVIAIDFCKRIGRKKSVICFMMAASIFCIVLGFIPKKGTQRIIRVTLGMLGKLCINVSFSAIYVWSTELYPTTTRANGMGFLQVTSRIGAAAAPWVAKGLQIVDEAAPFIVMGGTALIGSLVLVFIPETAGKPTLESDGAADDIPVKTFKTEDSKLLPSDQC